jgi:catechol 2,3-dioxygenase-like lactoylglutathione lyase family enzyme
MRIKLTGIFVDDQDRAREFYEDVLGMQVKVDAPYGDGGERWLTMVSPEDPDGAELLLELPDENARAYRRSIREAGKPATALVTQDCHADYDRLVTSGVTFTTPPTKMPYGGVDAVFDDSCGNLICLHQD